MLRQFQDSEDATDTPVDPAADPPGFVDFVAHHRTGLVRYAALLTGSAGHGEDIVHDVLVRLLPRWERLTDPLPYVRRSITNEYVSWRRRWSTRNITSAEHTDLDRPAEAPAETRPDPQMWAALMALTRSQRTALVLRYYEGLDDREIADVMGCRTPTVRSHIHRGIAAIRTILTNES